MRRRQVYHRRAEHEALEQFEAGMCDAQHDRAAHRMGQRKIGRRTIRQHDLLDEGRHVDLVLRKILDMALERIAQPARGMPLPPPVDDSHRITALAQIPYRFKIFFDVLAAPGEDTDGPPAARRCRPARKAQRGAIRRPDRSGKRPLWNGIDRYRQQRHGTDVQAAVWRRTT
jgi:hypothetical protein